MYGLETGNYKGDKVLLPGFLLIQVCWRSLLYCRMRILTVFQYDEQCLFHKNLPKSQMQMHWISARFYEIGDIFYMQT